MFTFGDTYMCFEPMIYPILIMKLLAKRVKHGYLKTSKKYLNYYHV